jgi:hypothetical protein
MGWMTCTPGVVESSSAVTFCAELRDRAFSV